MAACAGIGHYVKQINERKVSMDALKDAPVLELLFIEDKDWVQP
jgi:hypothetical protein